MKVVYVYHSSVEGSKLLLKCGGTRAETRFRLSAKRTSPFKSAGFVSSFDVRKSLHQHKIQIIQPNMMQQFHEFIT